MRTSFLALSLSLAVSLSGCFLAPRVEGPTVETIPVGACNPVPCAKITIATLPELPESFTTAARTAVLERVNQALYAPLDDADGNITRARFIQSVQSQYEEYMAVKDPEAVVDWQVSRSAFIIYASQDFASVVVKNEGYLGGAHGFNDEQLFVFDGKSGKVFSLSDLLSPGSKEIFTKAAEAEFRRARNIKPSETLEEAGFTFENNSFALSNNFAITDKGISLHYNPYEVGPYVMGATDVMVPLDVARPALNADVLSLPPNTQAKGLL